MLEIQHWHYTHLDEVADLVKLTLKQLKLYKLAVLWETKWKFEEKKTKLLTFTFFLLFLKRKKPTFARRGKQYAQTGLAKTFLVKLKLNLTLVKVIVDI